MKILPACYRESFQDADYCRLKSIERSEVPNARRTREYARAHAACVVRCSMNLDELRNAQPRPRANINFARKGNATTQLSISSLTTSDRRMPRGMILDRFSDVSRDRNELEISERFGANILFSLLTASRISKRVGRTIRRDTTRLST